MNRSKKILAALILFLALPVFAAAPGTLSVLLGGVPMEGKALWYEDQIYVPLESVSKAVGGEYHFDESQGIASVNIRGTKLEPRPQERPYLKVKKQRTYSTGDNLKVLATIINTSGVPAEDIEVTCTFRDSSLQEITASVAQLPLLRPGQRKTIEFWLYEQRLPDAEGGRPYAQPIAIPSNSNIAPSKNHVWVGQAWARVTHKLDIDY